MTAVEVHAHTVNAVAVAVVGIERVNSPCFSGDLQRARQPFLTLFLRPWKDWIPSQHNVQFTLCRTESFIVRDQSVNRSW